jgi:hypothetical protein
MIVLMITNMIRNVLMIPNKIMIKWEFNQVIIQQAHSYLRLQYTHDHIILPAPLHMSFMLNGTGSISKDMKKRYEKKGQVYGA